MLPPLKHAWKGCICQGTATEILRADVQQHLRFLQREIGYRAIRFHATRALRPTASRTSS